jgi:hypothetical protein
VYRQSSVDVCIWPDHAATVQAVTLDNLAAFIEERSDSLSR